MKSTDKKMALKAIKKQLRSQNETSLKAKTLSLKSKQDSSELIKNDIDDENLFRDAVVKVKPLVIDTIHPVKKAASLISVAVIKKNRLNKVKH